MKKYALNKRVFAFVSLFFAFVISCSDDGPVNFNEETVFVSKEKIFDYTAAELLQIATFHGAEIAPEYDVEAYKITYYTKKKNQAPLLCSGIFCIPKTQEKLRGITAWQHGTMFYDGGDMNEKYSYEMLERTIAASFGYISVANDYIGFGKSNSEIQAYHIAKYTTSDCIDLLKAAHNYIQNENISIDYYLWLAGYSQGGYNVVAIQKEWEEQKYSLFELKEVYAGDGALILSNMASLLFYRDTYDEPGFFPLFIRGYNHYYDMNLNYSHIYQPEYAGKIDKYYIDKDDTLYFLPKKLDSLFTESFINDMRSGNGSVYAKLIENNLNNFTPASKLYIFHSKGDELIPYEIGAQAYSYYQSVSGNVEFVEAPNDWTHSANYVDFLKFVLAKLN